MPRNIYNTDSSAQKRTKYGNQGFVNSSAKKGGKRSSMDSKEYRDVRNSVDTHECCLRERVRV